MIEKYTHFLTGTTSNFVIARGYVDMRDLKQDKTIFSFFKLGGSPILTVQSKKHGGFLTINCKVEDCPLHIKNEKELRKIIDMIHKEVS